QTEVIQKPIISSVKAAFAADKGIDFSGNSEICGYNHMLNTPTGTRGRPPCDTWEKPTGNLPASWSSSTITSGGSSNQNGTPVNNSQNQAGFYAGPWEALGMGQADFYSWVGAPVTTEPASPKGIYYLDNNTVSQDASGSFKYNGGSGDGLLYVDGDL